MPILTKKQEEELRKKKLQQEKVINKEAEPTGAELEFERKFGQSFKEAPSSKILTEMEKAKLGKPSRLVPGPTANVLVSEARAAQEAATVAQTRAEEQVPFEAGEIPSGVETGTPLEAAAQIPIAGGTIRAGLNSNDLKSLKLNKLSPERTAEVMTALNLTDFDVEVLRAGDADVSALSQIGAGIPIIGKIRFGSGGVRIGVNDLLGDSPTRRTEQLFKDMDDAVGSSELALTAAKLNPLLKNTWMSQVNAKRDEMLRIQSQIKLISIQNPEVQSNPEMAIRIAQDIEDKIRKLDNILFELSLIQ
jgi:hypothetical protein